MPPSLTATMYRQVLKAVQKVDNHYQHNASHTMRAILGQSWNPKYWEETLQLSKTTEAGGKKKGSKVTQTDSLLITSKFFKMCLQQFALEQKAAASATAGGGSAPSEVRVNSNMTTEMQKVFWLLKQCQAAVPPNADSSKKSAGAAGKSEEEAAAANGEGSFIDRATKVEFLGDETTTFSVRTVIPTMKAHNPLPRHSVPEDPVWMLQTSWSYPSPLCTELLLLEACYARLLNERNNSSLAKKVKAATGKDVETGLTNMKTDIVSLLASEQLTRAKMREYFLKLPAQTTVITPDGLLEIVCRTEHVGTVRRVKSQAKEEAEDDDDDDDDDDASSKPADGGKTIKEEHAFHYFIAIRNVSDTVANEDATPVEEGKLPRAKAASAVKPAKGKTLTLLSRHWSFIDAETGDVREVTGAGVVGQFPTLAPGESHTYVSGTTMAGKYGYMKGSFQFAVHNDAEPIAAAAAVVGEDGTTPAAPKAKGVKKGMKAVVKKTKKKSPSESLKGNAPPAEEETVSTMKLDQTVNAEIGATSLYTTSMATDFEPFGFSTDKK